MRDALPRVSLMHKLVSKANKDLPIFTIKPQYILATDDTVMYIYEGKGAQQDTFRLVGSNSINQSDTRSKYKFEEGNDMKGMRFKLIFTFSGVGCCAPLFI